MRIFLWAIGAALVAAGLFFSLGSIEVVAAGGTLEEIAQSFLAAGTLVLLGLIALWFAWKGRGRG